MEASFLHMGAIVTAMTLLAMTRCLGAHGCLYFCSSAENLESLSDNESVSHYTGFMSVSELTGTSSLQRNKSMTREEQS